MAFLFDQIGGSVWWRGATSDPWKRQTMAYSGFGDGLNNPTWQAVHNQGPLPIGEYTLVLENHSQLGPIVFALDPDSTNNMLGRSAFFLHWDNAEHNMTASEGCIVARDLPFFQFVLAKVKSGDNHLTVTSLPPLADPPRT